MHEAEALLTLAEIAVTLAGFSGLVATLRSRSLEDWHPRDLLILWLILGLGGMSMLFALVPFSMFQAGFAAERVWRVASLLFLLALIAAVARAVQESRRVSREGHPVRTPRVNALASSVAILSGAGLATNAVWLAQAWPYSSVLTLLLALSFLYLAAFIFNIQSERVRS